MSKSLLCRLGLHGPWHPLVLDLNYGTREEKCGSCGRIQIEYRDGTVLDVTELPLAARLRLTHTWGCMAHDLRDKLVAT